MSVAKWPAVRSDGPVFAICLIETEYLHVVPYKFKPGQLAIFIRFDTAALNIRYKLFISFILFGNFINSYINKEKHNMEFGQIKNWVYPFVRQT